MSGRGARGRTALTTAQGDGGAEYDGPRLSVAIVVRRFSLRGGNEKKAIEVARGLKQRGHNVRLLCQKVDPAASPEGMAVERLAGLSWDPSLALLSFCRASQKRLRRLRGENAIDVALGFSDCWGADVFRLGAGVHAAYLKRRTRTKPVLDRAALWAEARRFGPGGYRRLIVPSQAVADEASSFYPAAKDRIDVVRNGVDLDRFAAESARERLRQSWSVAPDERVAVFIGHELERKGFQTAVASTQQANLRLIYVGAAARPASLPAHVVWLGFRADVPQVLAASDVLILPSHYEPIGNVVLEAWAAGRPAVVSGRVHAMERARGSSLFDLVVAEPGDIDGFAAALSQAVTTDWGPATAAMRQTLSMSAFVGRVESVLVRARTTAWR